MTSSLVLAWLATTPTARALADPIPRCQHLLVEAKERLAQMEMEKFEALRIRGTGVHRMLRGLLLKTYEAALDQDGLTKGDAYALVPAHRQTAAKYMDQAVAQELLEFTRGTDEARTLVRAGPRLATYVRAELSAHLARVYRDAGQLPLAAELRLGAPPPTRSETLDRLLIKSSWLDYDRIWQTGANEDQIHLRNSYGLLAHLYKLSLRAQKANVRSAHHYIPLGNDVARRKITDAVVEHEFVEITTIPGPVRTRFIRATPKATTYVEGRINGAIERTNAILRRARED